MEGDVQKGSIPVMKRHLLAAALALSTAACGWYTNIPASVYVKSVTPGTLNYGATDTRGVREIKIDNPNIVLQGEPGSIGVNFDSVVVRYLLSNGTESKNLPRLSMGMTFRVESSNYPSRPDEKEISLEAVGKQIAAGVSTVTIPVITRHVEQFGEKATGDAEANAAAITAEVTMSGFDDANLPVSLVARVPIFFSGTPGTGQ